MSTPAPSVASESSKNNENSVLPNKPMLLSPAPAKPKLGRGKRHLKVAATSLVILVLIGLSLYASINALITTHEVKASVMAHKHDGNAAPAIDESKPPENSLSGYHVAPDLPRVIRIDSIGVAARVLHMGILPNNELNTPKSSYDAGWYEGSAKPGESGAMILNGHYAGPTKPGIFHNLASVKAGSVVTIEKGDGTVLSYKVTSIQTMPAGDVPMTDLLVSKNPGRQDLNIITCTGTFDQKTQTYDKRVVLRATAL
ncbi:MAG TPA: class F sortase [Candidatus Saccharimonadales bacterium]